MNDIPFLKEKFSEIGPVLPSYAGDQGNSLVGHGNLIELCENRSNPRPRRHPRYDNIVTSRPAECKLFATFKTALVEGGSLIMVRHSPAKPTPRRSATGAGFPRDRAPPRFALVKDTERTRALALAKIALAIRRGSRFADASPPFAA